MWNSKRQAWPHFGLEEKWPDFDFTVVNAFFSKIAFFSDEKMAIFKYVFNWLSLHVIIGFQLFVYPLYFWKKSLKMEKIHIFEKISISSRDIHLNYIFRNRSRRAKIGFFYLDTLSFNSFQTT